MPGSTLPHAFVDDLDCPYVTPPDRPFDWFRSRMLGGRLVVPNHGRQYYRLGRRRFCAAGWLEPALAIKAWRTGSVVHFGRTSAGLSGTRDNLPWLPDSEIANLLTPTPDGGDAARTKSSVDGHMPGRSLSRYAPPLEALEAAAQTGRLQCRQGAVVREICVDDSGNVSGVSWIDHRPDPNSDRPPRWFSSVHPHWSPPVC